MTPLLDYLTQIRQAINAFAGVQVERYQEQFLTATRANLRIRLRLPDNFFLEISEALVAEEGEITWLSYRYHWQDPIGCLILRYDDAPHHQEIETFPDHKHIFLSFIHSVNSVFLFGISTEPKLSALGAWRIAFNSL